MTFASHKILSIFGLLSLSMIVLSGTTFATPYGSGSYGNCKYSEGCSESATPSPSPIPKLKNPSSATNTTTDPEVEATTPTPATPTATTNTTNPPDTYFNDNTAVTAKVDSKPGVFTPTKTKIVVGSFLLGLSGFFGWSMWFFFKRRHGSMSDNIVPPGGF